MSRRHTASIISSPGDVYFETSEDLKENVVGNFISTPTSRKPFITRKMQSFIEKDLEPRHQSESEKEIEAEEEVYYEEEEGEEEFWEDVPSAISDSDQKRALTSEEIELLQIEKERKAFERQKRLNDASLKKIKSGVSYRPARSTKPLTVPVGFNLILERTHGMKLRNMTPKKSVPKPRARKTASGLTIPEPFHLKTSVAVKQQNGSESPFVPLAVKVKEFEKTPKRFKKSATSSRIETLKQNANTTSSGLTLPKSPMLMTKDNVKSSEDKEIEEISKHPKFRATAVKPEILYKSDRIGVPTKSAVNLTEPQDFNFATDQRIMKHQEKHQRVDESDVKPRPFKASLLRREIFEKKLGIPAKNTLPVTEPKSPAITKPKKKVQFDEILATKPETSRRPNLKRKAVPEPFILPGEKISERKRQRFQNQIKAEEHELESARQFHSIPMPSSSPDQLPTKKVKKATKPRPFHLETEERGQKSIEAVDENETKASWVFKATPLPADNVFIPQKSTKPLTQSQEINLHTEERSKERSHFDQHIADVEKKQKALKIAEDQRKAEDEKKAIKKLRKEIVHKAQPIRKYAPINSMKKEIPLTEPQSPFIGDKRRTKKMTH